MLNFHSLFSGATPQSFINQLNLNVEQLQIIKNSRTLVREHLRESLPSVLKLKTNIEFPTQPKFFTQGSYSYETLNKPCHLPPQQADIDYGCYLPTESWVDNYRMPKIASKDFFEAVESSLDSLCKEMEWSLVRNKATCVRIYISKDIHIDIPLYAIPEKDFKKLIEARKVALDSRFMDSVSVKWEKLPTEHVMLAHREKGWVKSDPRLVVDWFDYQVELFSEQYRRVVRYLKAFRDFQWQSGGPSSLLIMVMAAHNFRFFENRDDLALFHVCNEIPKLLSGEIKNPVDESEDLTSRLDNRQLAINRFKGLRDTLEKAIYDSRSATDAVGLLRDQFGKRFPIDISRVKSEDSSDFAGGSAGIPLTNKIIGRTRAG